MEPTAEPEQVQVVDMTTEMRAASEAGTRHFCPVTVAPSWPPKKTCVVCAPKTGSGPAEE